MSRSSFLCASMIIAAMVIGCAEQSAPKPAAQEQATPAPVDKNAEIRKKLEALNAKKSNLESQLELVTSTGRSLVAGGAAGAKIAENMQRQNEIRMSLVSLEEEILTLTADLAK